MARFSGIHDGSRWIPLAEVARHWGVHYATVRRKFVGAGIFVSRYVGPDGTRGELMDVGGFDVLEIPSAKGTVLRYLRLEQVKAAS
ncbi:hypothetical protein HN371_19910 [Candidatus Poribacteria bacterium]|nr:hypothetical protein [Candidatus Poribacteria bacterium]MBT5534002.1 hypothetical protein [Candidatus Poribacteria bacterium]MBT5710110.1 hypothetical protein [Candidatus Poribacteria bacterium]MBT7099931.1 hypothetical protein [Candidatus Poribacteria bacterium]MBT7808064.1 hypothetical protein [Candidatus Poribacteria bacterium]